MNICDKEKKLVHACKTFSLLLIGFGKLDGTYDTFPPTEILALLPTHSSSSEEI